MGHDTGVQLVVGVRIPSDWLKTAVQERTVYDRYTSKPEIERSEHYNWHLPDNTIIRDGDYGAWTDWANKHGLRYYGEDGYQLGPVIGLELFEKMEHKYVSWCIPVEQTIQQGLPIFRGKAALLLERAGIPGAPELYICLEQSF